MYRIFIVEDDLTIALQMKSNIENWGYEVKVSENLESITGEFNAFAPHLVLMDIGLPFANGFFRCAEIRKTSQVPIIFVSSASDNINMVTAINMGDDDFICKPFDFSVLTAKIMAVIRRSYEINTDTSSSGCLAIGDAVYNSAKSTLNYGNTIIELSKNENRILLCLLENKGSIVSRNRLMEQLWNNDCFIDENTLSVNVNRLRKRLAEAGMPECVKTKKGQGYIIE